MALGKQTIKKLLLAGLGSLTLMSAQLSAQTGPYPNKPIRLVVPFAPGSLTDQLARLTASELGEKLKQSIVVENKPGGGGNIGAGYVATAPADGYTLLLGPASTNAINPSLYKNLKFNPLKDFVPIINVASVTNVLVVNPQVPAKTVKEFIELLKKGGNYSYASSGAGGSQHLAGELFKNSAGVEMQHIGYNGPSLILGDLFSNRVQAMFCNLPVCLPHIKSGKLVALGVTSKGPSEQLPGVPSINEAGLAGFEVEGWFGLFAPAGTPAAIVTLLNKEMQAILSSPSVKEKLLTMGAKGQPSSQEAFDKFVQHEHDKWAKVIKDAGIKLE